METYIETKGGKIHAMIDYFDGIQEAVAERIRYNEAQFKEYLHARGLTWETYKDQLRLFAVTKVLEDETETKVFYRYADVEPIYDFRTEDVIKILPEKNIVEIGHVWVPEEKRRTGIGSRLIQQIIDEHAEELIMLQMGLSVKEYPEIPEDFDYEALFAKLGAFYAKLGFINVHEVIGGSHDYQVCLYTKNKAGKELLNLLIEQAQAGSYPNQKRFLEQVGTLQKREKSTTKMNIF